MAPALVQLAALWVAKKFVLFGAIKAFGPGRLYRRTLGWNRVLLGREPSWLRLSVDRALGRAFRLPDQLASKQSAAAAAAAAAAAPRKAAAAAASGAAERRSMAAAGAGSSSMAGGFAALPLLQRAQSARKAVLLAGRQRLDSTWTQGRRRARSLLQQVTPGNCLPQRPALLMAQLRALRASHGQDHPLCR